MNTTTLIPLTPTIEWRNNKVRLIDPLKLTTEQEVRKIIKEEIKNARSA